jgi:hypothetical protein
MTTNLLQEAEKVSLKKSTKSTWTRKRWKAWRINLILRRIKGFFWGTNLRSWLSKMFIPPIYSNKRLWIGKALLQKITFFYRMISICRKMSWIIITLLGMFQNCRILTGAPKMSPKFSTFKKVPKIWWEDLDFLLELYLSISSAQTIRPGNSLTSKRCIILLNN